MGLRVKAKSEKSVVKFVNNLKLFGHGYSWGGFESLGLHQNVREQAENKLLNLGYKWQWHADGSLSAQTRVLSAIRAVDSGRQVFFNQIIAAYQGWQGVKENPSVGICFGDDSAIPRHFLDKICEIAADTAYDLMWQDGDVAVVDNHLSMHGRRPYDGDRVRRVLVTLGI